MTSASPADRSSCLQRGVHVAVHDAEPELTGRGIAVLLHGCLFHICAPDRLPDLVHADESSDTQPLTGRAGLASVVREWI